LTWRWSQKENFKFFSLAVVQKFSGNYKAGARIGSLSDPENIL
jgi:hypothetical protein